GAVRDAAALAGLGLGIKALGTCPRRTDKLGQGLRDVPVAFGGVVIEPGQWLAADVDGGVRADRALAGAGRGATPLATDAPCRGGSVAGRHGGDPAPPRHP